MLLVWRINWWWVDDSCRHSWWAEFDVCEKMRKSFFSGFNSIGLVSTIATHTFKNTVPSEDLVVADHATGPDFGGRLDEIYLSPRKLANIFSPRKKSWLEWKNARAWMENNSLLVHNMRMFFGFQAHYREKKKGTVNCFLFLNLDLCHSFHCPWQRYIKTSDIPTHSNPKRFGCCVKRIIVKLALSLITNEVLHNVAGWICLWNRTPHASLVAPVSLYVIFPVRKAHMYTLSEKVWEHTHCEASVTCVLQSIGA